jgi:uncharacterized delta-60 repeat protein
MKKNLVLIISLLMAAGLSAQNAGVLDTSFSSDGKVTTLIASNNDACYSIEIQPDGKLVASGYASISGNFDFATARYNTDGSLDLSFGNNGIVTTPIGTGIDFAFASALQGDGKIVVAGVASIGGNYDIALVRYLSDGNLDNTFGTNGIVTTDIGAVDQWVRAVAIVNEGKIVVAGRTNNDFMMARYNTDGSLDGSFGTAGFSVCDMNSGFDEAYTILVQPDSKIILSGAVSNGTSVFGLARFSAGGVLDTGFGTAGKVLTSVGPDALAHAAVLQTDGKIVLGGSTVSSYPNGDFALVRYNNNGTIDNSFGTSGTVITDMIGTYDQANTIILQNDGKIIAGGYCFSGTDDFALIRYNSDGTLDNTFGTGGKVTHTISADYDYIYDLAIQQDNKIVAAGWCQDGFALTRYFPGTVVGISETDGPDDFHLRAMASNGDVLLQYSLHKQARLEMSVTDLLGKTARQINTTGIQLPGNHEMYLKISDLKPGIYLLKFSAGNSSCFLKFFKQ